MLTYLLTSLMVSVDAKHHAYLLTSLMVSVDVKHYATY